MSLRTCRLEGQGPFWAFPGHIVEHGPHMETSAVRARPRTHFKSGAAYFVPLALIKAGKMICAMMALGGVPSSL